MNGATPASFTHRFRSRVLPILSAAGGDHQVLELEHHRFHPGDVVVLKIPQGTHISPAALSIAMQEMQSALPQGVRALLLTDGVRLERREEKRS